MKCKVITFLGDNKREYHYNLGKEKDLSRPKMKRYTFNDFKIRSFVRQNTTWSEWKGENICNTYQVSVFRTHKELLRIKKVNPIQKNGQKKRIEISQKRKHKWPTNTTSLKPGKCKLKTVRDIVIYPLNWLELRSWLMSRFDEPEMFVHCWMQDTLVHMWGTLAGSTTEYHGDTFRNNTST